MECFGIIDGGDVLYVFGMFFVGKSWYDFILNFFLYICDINLVFVVMNFICYLINMCLFLV